jgi:Mg2+-importing ATPase
VLAVAYQSVEVKPAYRSEDERDLTLAGFLAFLDPPLPKAKAFVEQLAGAGVEVKIITSDNDKVAVQVCRMAGLDVWRVVLGEELEGMEEAKLARVAEGAQLFARVNPAQKHRILRALRAKHVVAYMGDGINDAPSLHAADVGIATPTAVDVAREAASVVLLKPGLGMILDGIQEGRRAFGNVTKYLLMGTGSNFGNVFSMAGAVLVLPFLPMLPTQILLNNLLYDLAQVSIPQDSVDPEALRRPECWNLGLIRDFMLYVGPVSSLFDFLTFYVLLHFFQAGEREFHSGWFAESLATQTLVIFVIRTARAPWRSRPSPWLAASGLGMVALGLLLLFTPLAGPLGFVPLPPAHFAFLGGGVLVYLALVEAMKRWVFRRNGR